MDVVAGVGAVVVVADVDVDVADGTGFMPGRGSVEYLRLVCMMMTWNMTSTAILRQRSAAAMFPSMGQSETHSHSHSHSLAT